jgi:hypothetical protein
MTAKIHVLHPWAESLSGFLRVGHTGHRKLEALHAAGRFPYRRVVFDAAHIDEQQELLKMLKAKDCEIVLDPNFAEMSMLGRHGSAVTKLPWANPERPWEPSDFVRGRNMDAAKLIATLGLTSRLRMKRSKRFMSDVKSRLVRLRDAMADLQATEGTPSRSRSPAFRGGMHSMSAVSGR